MSNKKSDLEEHTPQSPLDLAELSSSIEKLASSLAPIARAFVEFLMERWGIRDPIEVLKECIEHREWFKGIVLSTAFFEGIGKNVLVNHFEGQIKSERIEHLRLEHIIMFLYTTKIIDQDTYSRMIKVKVFRNNIVHLDPFTELKLKPKEAEDIIGEAIICLSPLIKILFESKEKENNLIKLPPRPKLKKNEK